MTNMNLISKILLLQALTSCAVANTVFGVEHIENYNYSFKKPVYVQMASFSTPNAAANYQRHLSAKTHFKVSTRYQSGKYQVRIGPFNDPVSLNKLAQEFHQVQPAAAIIKPQYEQKPLTNLQTNVNRITNTSNWYVSAQVGGQETSSPTVTSVRNGSGFAPPYDQDIYTANKSSMNALVGLQVGRRWELPSEFLTALSLGAQYDYFCNSNVGGEVIQFSLPEFTNYNYKWQTASNLITANAKLNLFNYQRFSPYLNLGLGAVFHHSAYTEVALANVTPRISPGYGSQSNAQFTYILGAGLDYQFKPELILSAGYQYSDLGTRSSNYGSLTWSGERLDFGKYRSNAFLVGLTYLFESNSRGSYQK